MFGDGACKALGAARVVLALGWTPVDERAAAPALALHEAFAAAGRALAAQIATYNNARQARHQLAAEVPPKAVPCTAFGHAQFCEPPARLPALVERWRTTLAFVDATSLVPQSPTHLAHKPKRPRAFLTSLEVTLEMQGWSHDEIIAVLDAAIPGEHTARQRKASLRKRLGKRPAGRSGT